MTAFHLSLVAPELEPLEKFYVELLGCRLGRAGPAHVDLDFFGHQLTFHRGPKAMNVPYQTLHFGAVVAPDVFARLRARLEGAADFVIPPQCQAAGSPDERSKMVFLDPAGYAVELKCYSDGARLLVDAPAYPRPL